MKLYIKWNLTHHSYTMTVDLSKEYKEQSIDSLQGWMEVSKESVISWSLSQDNDEIEQMIIEAMIGRVITITDNMVSKLEDGRLSIESGHWVKFASRTEKSLFVGVTPSGVIWALHKNFDRYDTIKERLEALHAKKKQQEPKKQEIDEDKAWRNFEDKRKLFKEIREMYDQKITIRWGEWSVRDTSSDHLSAEGDRKPRKADVLKHYKTGLTVRFDCHDGEEWDTALVFFDGVWNFEELL